jgi:ribonuclease HI
MLSSTQEVVAMAIKEAMEEIIQRGLSHVIFENDSKIVVDAISSRAAYSRCICQKEKQPYNL